MTLSTSLGVPTARRSAPASAAATVPVGVSAPAGLDTDPARTAAEGAAPAACVEPDAGPGRPARHRRPGRLRRWWRALVRRARLSADSGMATAEYAIVTVAAAAFAGLLIAVLRSDEVRGLLVGIIRGALSV